MNEESYPALEIASTDPAEQPDLPVNSSDAIIVGTIAAQHAYLSADQTAIYTEFKVPVEQWLKASKDFSQPADNLIDIER